MLALPPEHCLCCLWGCCATLLRILMWSPMRKRAAHDGFLVVGGLALSFPTILQQRGLVPRRAMSLRKTLLVFHSNECISFFFFLVSFSPGWVQTATSWRSREVGFKAPNKSVAISDLCACRCWLHCSFIPDAGRQQSLGVQINWSFLLWGEVQPWP